MKFAIRDDDLNFYYTPDFIDKNLREVFEICPVSLAAIPLVKGNWKKNTETLEKVGPGAITVEIARAIRSDDKIFTIDQNQDLVGYIKEMISTNKISIAIHGIHHRNEDSSPPILVNNFSLGAEFHTDRNLTLPLQKGVQILERCFGEKIEVFTPPQNSYSLLGAQAVFESGLNVCGYLPSIRNWKMFINLFGKANYLKYLNHRVQCKQRGLDQPYPHVLRHKGHAIADHCALQPGTSSSLLMEKFRRVYAAGGHFVLSTHSYGFDYQMKDSRRSMKHCLLEILNEASKLSDVRFVSLNEIFAE